MSVSQNGPKSLFVKASSIREEFPFFTNTDTVYLDSAATAQKPKVVLDAMDEYYKKYCANIHRSAHGLANKATSAFEEARQSLQDFINAKSPDEIVFTKGATEGINLVAQAYVKNSAKNVIISSVEHHSNILPWQLIDKPLAVIRSKEDLQPDLGHFETLLQENPNAFVSLVHTSNAFGITLPIKQMIQIAHEYGCKVLVDATQSAVHKAIDIQDLDADFLVLSAHKLYGPTGVGALYIKEELHSKCKPYQGGGGAIEEVFYDKTRYMPIPYMYEAGTSNIAGVIGFASALTFMKNRGFEFIQKHENELIRYAHEKLLGFDDVILYANPKQTMGNISFNIAGIHHHDLGILLDKQKIQARVGHHCAQPTMRMLGIDGTVRISFGIYNNKADIDAFFKALNRAVKMLKE